MSDIDSEIRDIVLGNERLVNDHWNNKDYLASLNSSREDATYFDPWSDNCLFGRDAIQKHFEKYYTGLHVVRADWIEPQVVVNDTKDVAVLTYNLHNFIKGEDGALVSVPQWNCSEVYRLTDGQWKIAHTHWSFTRHPALTSLQSI